MFPPSTIDTARLRLRPPVQTDAQAIFEGYATDPEVVRYLAWRPHRNIAQTREYLASAIACWTQGKGHRPWAIVSRHEASPGSVMGMIGTTPERTAVSVGFVLARAHWNRGYMTEALRRVVELALAERDIFRVWAVCDAENAASARVMEKSGMRFEGMLARFGIHPNVSTEPRDVKVYAATR